MNSVIKKLVKTIGLSPLIRAELEMRLGCPVLELRPLTPSEAQSLRPLDVRGTSDAFVFETLLDKVGDVRNTKYTGFFAVLFVNFLCGFVYVNLLEADSGKFELSTYIKPECRGLGLSALAKVVYVENYFVRLQYETSQGAEFESADGDKLRFSSVMLVSKIGAANRSSLRAIRPLLVPNESNVRFIIYGIENSAVVFALGVAESLLADDDQVRIFKSTEDGTTYDVLFQIKERQREEDFDIADLLGAFVRR